MEAVEETAPAAQEPETTPVAEGESVSAPDPIDEFRKELRRKPGEWYVVHSYAGYEKSVKQAIEARQDNQAGGDDILEVEVPHEEVLEMRNGQRKLVKRVRIPSYVLVRMFLNEDSWSLIRHTPGVTGFVGNAHNPTPLRFKEAFDMLVPQVQQEIATQEAEEAAAAVAEGKQKKQAVKRVIPTDIEFEVGETITIKEGSFTGLPGTISEINPASGKITVLVSLFERETPVELSFDQVVKLA